MELTDSQIGYFVDNRLRLPKGKRTEYLAQVDRLIEKFAAAAKGDDVIGVKTFLKTGSLRKGTALRPKGDFGVDADVAVFLDTNGASKFDLANLVPTENSIEVSRAVHTYFSITVQGGTGRGAGSANGTDAITLSQ